MKKGVVQLHGYGYRVSEVPVTPPSTEIREGSSITIHPRGARPQRPVSVSLPMYVTGVFMPTPDLNDVSNVVLGATKRVINPIPARKNEQTMKRFKKFVRGWIQTNLVPLAADSDTSVETWLSSTDYPDWRRRELAEIASAQSQTDIEERMFQCKSFLKYETYAEYKNPRTINPRPDQFKVFSGPIFKLIEKVVFQMPEFIKKVPLGERPDYIMENVYVPGSMYFVTDYSSFESSFTPDVLDACELQLYDYMTSRLEGGKTWSKIIRKALMGKQTLRFGVATVETKGTRMSGDMCTSLGNGFTNMMLMLFAGHEFGLGKMRAVFEGDDGLGCFERGIPNADFFEELGFTVKMEVVSELFEASFCGMVFDPDARQKMNDPFKFFANLGWTSSQYLGARNSKLMGLLKAKAMSGLYEWKGAPMIPHLCIRIMQLAGKYDWRVVYKQRGINGWLREWYDEISKADLTFEEPKIETRLLFERRYGIDVQTQIRFEQRVKSFELGPLDLWEITFDKTWEENWSRYISSPNWLSARTHAQYSQTSLLHPLVEALLISQANRNAAAVPDGPERAAYIDRELTKIHRLISVVKTRVD